MIHERIRQLEALDERIKLLNQERKELTTIPEGEVKKYGFSHEVGDVIVQPNKIYSYFGIKVYIEHCFLVNLYNEVYYYGYGFKTVKKDGTPSLNGGYFYEEIKGL